MIRAIQREQSRSEHPGRGHQDAIRRVAAEPVGQPGDLCRHGGRDPLGAGPPAIGQPQHWQSRAKATTMLPAGGEPGMSTLLAGASNCTAMYCTPLTE